jgi:F-type H+-transporting ATPase subunit delta
MAESATLARPYAEAVFGLADKAGALPAWSKTLAVMAAVAAHADVRACIGNPNLGAERLYGLFVSLCGTRLSVEAQNFVRVLIANDRLVLLPEIHARYEELRNEREGVVEAEIHTAFRLGKAQLAGIVADLEKRFKRKVQPHETVDKELIGGVRIIVGDEVIDGSVRGKLEDMAAALKS